MRWLAIPTPGAVLALAGLTVAAAAALVLGRPVEQVSTIAGVVLALAAIGACVDLCVSLRRWHAAPLRIERNLPGAFSLGSPVVLVLYIVNEGPLSWQVAVFDEVDPHCDFHGMPQTVRVPARGRVQLRYTTMPRLRGLAQFGVTGLRWRSRAGCFEIRMALGQPRALRVYPNFAAMVRYTWLAGDQRLRQIGVKSYVQRGLGTDFRQLADYRTGDALRHIDWKATLRHQRPIVREFQDDRDQCVFFLLDSGRRMRADESGTTDAHHRGSHFDEALNAMMLLAHVALGEGDEVGAMTFGAAPGQRRDFAPRKGAATLIALMNRMHDLQPGPHQTDYQQAARDLLSLQRRRALVIVLTNFRDEDAAEFLPALQLMRRKHLVLVASLRETVLSRLARQAMAVPEDAVVVAAAHLFMQSRRDAFARVMSNDRLSVDVEPSQLASALVNRYRAVKKSGLL